jgi:hypothetical protein
VTELDGDDHSADRLALLGRIAEVGRETGVNGSRGGGRPDDVLCVWLARVLSSTHLPSRPCAQAVAEDDLEQLRKALDAYK